MTSQWLIDSFEKGHFLPPNDYLLPIFKGLSLGVLGFNNEEINEIKSIFEQEGGDINTSLAKVQEGKDLHLIMVKSSEIKRYESLISAHQIPVVTIEWLKNCLISRQYLKPKKYAINFAMSLDRQSIQQKLNETVEAFQNVEGFISKAYHDHEVGDDHFEYLGKVIVYFHNIPDKIEKIQKKLVNFGGGIYVKELIPEVTHIIVEEYTQEEIKFFHKFRKPKIVEIFWLLDCFRYKRLLKEDDYYVGSLPQMIADYRSKTPPNKVFGDAKPSVSLSRRNTISYQLPRLGSSGSDGPMEVPKMPQRAISNQMNRRNSVAPPGTLAGSSCQEENEKKSGKEEQEKPKATPEKMQTRSTRSSQKQSKSKKPVPVKSVGYIFKNINIYFDPKFKEAAQYKKHVQENSGNVLDTLNVFEEIFYVLPDAEESVQTLQKNKKRNINFVSYRWIDYCLKNKMVVRDYAEKKLVYLLPFPHRVPLADFTNTTVYAAGLPPYDKKILKEIIELIGAKFVYEP